MSLILNGKGLSAVVLAALLLGFVSCNKELSVDEPSSSEICFAAENASFTAEVRTKASTGTSEVTSLSSFKVSAVTGAAGSESSVWNNVIFSGSGDYTAGKVWPASDPLYGFYATNCIGDMSFNASGTTISVTNTHDVVCAYLPSSRVTYKSKNLLSFEHVFARISTVMVIEESGYTISSVSMTITPKTGGTYNLRTGAGATDDTGWSLLTVGEPVTIASSTGANSNDVWLVPGIYSVTAGWVATQSDGSSITYTGKTVDLVITRGKRNAITATLGGEMYFGVELEEFDDVDVPLAFGLHQSSSGGRFSFSGGQKSLTLSGYSGTWSISYSMDGGATFSDSAPSGLSVTRISSNQGEQVYSVSVSAVTPSASGISFGSTWPSDSRYRTSIGTPAAPVDLSLLDINGNILLDGRSTANTYVVHAPGTYMIPLVYGNAITDGSANTQSYICPKSGSSIFPVFKNIYDTGISSPYIETDVASNGHSVASASLVWSERTGLISVKTDLETHNGIKYLVFSIPSETIGYGNAVISVKDDSGSVVWSWLVWVTAHELWDERVEARVSPASREVYFLSEGIGTIPPNGIGDLYEPSECIVKFSTPNGQALTYTVSITGGHKYTSYSSPTKMPFYQFGRPTPSPSSLGAVEGSRVINDNKVSAAMMLMHPEMIFICSNNSETVKTWLFDDSGDFLNIWNNNQTAANQDVAVIKTVYDPCPAGYCMPQRNDFTYFHLLGYNINDASIIYFNVVDFNKDNTISSSDFSYGWLMKRFVSDTEGLYFPAASYCEGGGGSVVPYFEGTRGYYWTSCPNNANTTRALHFHNTSLNPIGFSEWTNGFCVRPVKIQ